MSTAFAARTREASAAAGPSAASVAGASAASASASGTRAPWRSRCGCVFCLPSLSLLFLYKIQTLGYGRDEPSFRGGDEGGLGHRMDERGVLSGDVGGLGRRGDECGPPMSAASATVG